VFVTRQVPNVLGQRRLARERCSGPWQRLFRCQENALTLIESRSANTSEGQAPVAGCEVDSTVVWLHGELGISTVTALSQTIARAMAFSRADLVVDLSGVQFMDAATIGVIIRARNDLELQFRSLMRRAPSKFARRVLELCGLTDLLDPPSFDSTTLRRPRAAETCPAPGESSSMLAPCPDRPTAHVTGQRRGSRQKVPRMDLGQSETRLKSQPSRGTRSASVPESLCFTSQPGISANRRSSCSSSSRASGFAACDSSGVPKSAG
jgi:anti-anti-sigma factor